MLETIFGSILTAGLTGSAFVICLLVALALGALVAAERNRTRLNAPETATPAPRLPFTSRMMTCTIAGSSASVTTMDCV